MKIQKKLKEINLRQFDFWIFISVMLLLSAGLIMIFSASGPSSASKYDGDAYFFFRNQLRNAMLGLVVMAFFAILPYRIWGKLSVPMLLVSIGLLIVLIVPGATELTKGSKRWIYLSFISFQPSEITKFALICFLSASLAKRGDRVKQFGRGLLPYVILLVVIVVLLMLEPHLSGTVIVLAISVIILFVAGAKIWHFIALAIPTAGIGYLCITYIENFKYIRDRITGHANPWLDAKDSGFQIIQSLYAIATGGLFGRGIGKSIQKFSYIPEPHNDFIFAIWAEETGFIGVAGVLMLFLILIWRGLKVSMMVKDRLGCLLSLGITTHITIQVVFNIAVVTQIIPVTGISLPFFSYGGTSLILLMAEIGVLLNISKSVHIDTVLPVEEISAAQHHQQQLIKASKV